MAGSPVTLTWSATNATSCTATGGWTGARSASGTEASGNLAQATTFTLACTGAGGNATAQVTINVTHPLPVVTVTATPVAIAAGASTQIEWSVTNATACTASGGWTGARATQGTETSAVLNANAAFTLTCTGPGGSANGSSTVRVLHPVSASLFARPSAAEVGDISRLSWLSENADNCEASGAWSGAQPDTGTQLTTPLPAGLSTFTLVCSNALGSATSTVSIDTRAEVKLRKFQFVEQSTATHSSEGLLPIPGEPLVGARMAQAVLKGPVATASFEVENVEGSLLSAATLTLHPATEETQAYFEGPITVPAVSFSIRVRGTRTDGAAFEIPDTRVYEPAMLRLGFSSIGAELLSGVATPVELVVENPNSVAVNVVVLCGGEAPLTVDPIRADVSVPPAGSAPLIFNVTPTPPIQLVQATPKLTCTAMGLDEPAVGSLNTASIVLAVDDVISAEVTP